MWPIKEKENEQLLIYSGQIWSSIASCRNASLRFSYSNQPLWHYPYGSQRNSVVVLLHAFILFSYFSCMYEYFTEKEEEEEEEEEEAFES